MTAPSAVALPRATTVSHMGHPPGWCGSILIVPPVRLGEKSATLVYSWAAGEMRERGAANKLRGSAPLQTGRRQVWRGFTGERLAHQRRVDILRNRLERLRYGAVLLGSFGVLAELLLADARNLRPRVNLDVRDAKAAVNPLDLDLRLGLD